MMLGCFVAWFFLGEHSWRWPIATVVCAFIGAAVGGLEDFVAVRPLLGRKGGNGILVTTVGVSVVIQGCC